MSRADTSNMVSNINGSKALSRAIELTNQCLARDRFSFDVIRDHLDIIKNAGEAVKNSKNFSTLEEYHKTLKKTARLSYNIDLLSNKTQTLMAHFEDFEAPFSKYLKVFRAANYLNQALQKAIALSNGTFIENFQEACRKITPSSLIEKLISFVENDIKSETFENKEQFEQWKVAVESLLTQFLLIKAFSIGLQSETKLEELKNLARKISDTLEDMVWNPENWKEDWMTTVTELVEKIQDNNVHQNNSRKADLLRDILEVLFKNYAFYVIVFNDCDHYGFNMAFDGTEDQYIFSMQRGLCNVIVYRSYEWNHTSQRERTNFISQVNACRNGVVPWCENYNEFSEDLRSDHIQNTGFVGLIRNDQYPEVRSVNCGNDGPGYWITATNEDDEEFILISGYK